MQERMAYNEQLKWQKPQPQGLLASGVAKPFIILFGAPTTRFQAEPSSDWVLTAGALCFAGRVFVSLVRGAGAVAGGIEGAT